MSTDPLLSQRAANIMQALILIGIMTMASLLWNLSSEVTTLQEQIRGSVMQQIDRIQTIQQDHEKRIRKLEQHEYISGSTTR